MVDDQESVYYREFITIKTNNDTIIKNNQLFLHNNQSAYFKQLNLLMVYSILTIINFLCVA